MHRLYVRQERWPIAGTLPLLLQRTLFEHGLWYQSYRLWERFLNHAPEEVTEAHQWLKFGKSAQLLGRRDVAAAALATSRRRAPTALDAAQAKMLEAALAKDAGERERVDEIMGLYAEAVELLARARAAESDPEGLRDIDLMAAALRYNRAIVQRWWTGERPAAIAEMAAVFAAYRELGDRLMEHVSRSEWADMQIEIASAPAEWESIFDTLTDVDRFFADSDNPGDRALARYRLARAYRRSAVGDGGRPRLELAAAAFAGARDLARRAGDLRLELIAETHVVGVDWQLHHQLPVEVVATLDRAITFLSSFDDAWSTRVRRDALVLRALVALQAGQGDEASRRLEQALATGMSVPLRPRLGTDARRASWILGRLLGVFEQGGRRLEAVSAARTHRDLIEDWLEGAVEVEDVSSLQERLCGFGNQTGEYYG